MRGPDEIRQMGLLRYAAVSKHRIRFQKKLEFLSNERKHQTLRE